MFGDGVTIGGIAQLGERLLCKQEVVGSIPSASTSSPGVDGSGEPPGLRGPLEGTTTRKREQ